MTIDAVDHGEYRHVNVTIGGIPNPGFTEWQRLDATSDDMFALLQGMAGELSRDGQGDPVRMAAWLHFWRAASAASHSHHPVA
eukprot:m51a1_g11313 hypothetical protein (83) ;mRNA; f:99988-100336